MSEKFFSFLCRTLTAFYLLACWCLVLVTPVILKGVLWALGVPGVHSHGITKWGLFFPSVGFGGGVV